MSLAKNLSRFPKPSVPDTSVFQLIYVQSLIIAIVGYCITLSMAKIFAAKFDYKIDGNQELFSEVGICFEPSLSRQRLSQLSIQGVSNVFGSFFASMPSGASMSRSMVQVSERICIYF